MTNMNPILAIWWQFYHWIVVNSHHFVSWFWHLIFLLHLNMANVSLVFLIVLECCQLLIQVTPLGKDVGGWDV